MLFAPQRNALPRRSGPRQRRPCSVALHTAHCTLHTPPEHRRLSKDSRYTQENRRQLTALVSPRNLCASLSQFRTALLKSHQSSSLSFTCSNLFVERQWLTCWPTLPTFPSWERVGPFLVPGPDGISHKPEAASSYHICTFKSSKER